MLSILTILNMTQYHYLLTTIIGGMDSLARIVEKAELLVQEKNVTEQDILEARLAPDMFPFVSQVRIATDDARRNLFLLAGKEHVKMEDNETTLAMLKDRITTTKNLLLTLSQQDFDGADDRKISLFWMQGAYVLGRDFINVYPVQNTYFHIITAYNIVRHLGGSIGKMDYIGGFPMMHE